HAWWDVISHEQFIGDRGGDPGDRRRGRRPSSGAGATTFRLATGLACELLFECPDYEVHDGDVRLDAVELQLTMELLRDPRRELYPNFPLTCHNAPFPGHGRNSRLCF